MPPTEPTNEQLLEWLSIIDRKDSRDPVVNRFADVSIRAMLAAREKFDSHTKAVGEFLSEMRAIMIDPLADEEIKVAKAIEELKQAALDNRNAIFERDSQIAALRRNLEVAERLASQAAQELEDADRACAASGDDGDHVVTTDQWITRIVAGRDQQIAALYKRAEEAERMVRLHELSIRENSIIDAMEDGELSAVEKERDSLRGELEAAKKEITMFRASLTSASEALNEIIRCHRCASCAGNAESLAASFRQALSASDASVK